MRSLEVSDEDPDEDAGKSMDILAQCTDLLWLTPPHLTSSVPCDPLTLMPILKVHATQTP